MLFLGVPSLPKGALVEKQVMLHTGRFRVPGEDEVEVLALEPSVTEGTLSSGSADIHWAVSSFANSASPCAVICIRGEVDGEMEAKFDQELPVLLDHTLSVRVFYRPSSALSCTYLAGTTYTARPDSLDTDDPHILLKKHGMAITSVPCHFVSNAGRDDWDYAICIVGV